jgi:hypothetical protein
VESGKSCLESLYLPGYREIHQREKKKDRLPDEWTAGLSNGRRISTAKVAWVSSLDAFEDSIDTAVLLSSRGGGVGRDGFV